MRAEQRVRELLLAGVTGALLVACFWALYVTLCPGGVICDAIARQPPWTLLGAIAAAPSVWWTWVLRTTHKDQDNALAREQYITTQLLECLKLLQKKDEPHSQIGGVYALERVARESPAAIATVLDVLCAFIRTSRELPQTEDEFDNDQTAVAYIGLSPLPAAIQVALDVLGRLPIEDTSMRVDLSNTDLRLARLCGRFGRASFRGAWLDQATLNGDFRGADFVDACLKDTSIANVHEPDKYKGAMWPKDGMPTNAVLPLLGAELSKLRSSP